MYRGTPCIPGCVYKMCSIKTAYGYQGTNARKVNCGRVYFAYKLKPVLSGWTL